MTIKLSDEAARALEQEGSILVTGGPGSGKTTLALLKAQQLIPTPDGKARRVAVEVMLGTPLVQDYIRKGEVHKLKDVMKESTNLGMKTFDQALFELYQAGEISYEDALRFADSSNEVRLKIKLAQGGDAHTLSQGMDGVELVEG